MLAELRNKDLAPRPWNPLELFRAFEPNWPALWNTPNAFVPKMDVFEDHGEMVVRTDLPGVERKDVKVALDGEDLVIEGERKLERNFEKDGLLRQEREMGQFRRRLALDFEADPKLIKATFKDGILEVRLPITAEPTASRAEIPVS
ncbi:MAG: Hsp20/alpha crystallin family protein [Thermoanaerobaculia bacterium]|nr:Hsp20/alpha crystallin family protein [Thermoanaerobaculia bacterium]